MAKTKKPKEDAVTAKVLMRRLRGMMQLQQIEKEDRFLVIITTSAKSKFWVEWSQLVEVFEDFKAIVDAKKLKK